jgi:hypothetical protein
MPISCEVHGSCCRGTENYLLPDATLTFTELSGRQWAGKSEGPLARGREADELIARAEAWAARHLPE